MEGRLIVEHNSQEYLLFSQAGVSELVHTQLTSHQHSPRSNPFSKPMQRQPQKAVIYKDENTCGSSCFYDEIKLFFFRKRSLLL